MAIPTKDQLFDKYFEKAPSYTEIGRGNCLELMDIHSKNIAIGFFVWIVKSAKSIDTPVEELFNQYLQSLTQQQ